MKNTESLSAQINRLFDDDQYEEARTVLLNCLSDKPDDHWLLARLATTYYEQRNYAEALDTALRSLAIAPNCPLALWEAAGAFYGLDRTAEAVGIYRQLIFERGPERIASEQCGEGVARARSLVADCVFRLGLCYRELNRDKDAVRCLLSYVNLRVAGVRSIYKVREAKRALASLKQVRASFVAERLQDLELHLEKPSCEN